MLRYSDDKRYILCFSKTTYITTWLGPYDKDMLPEIKNNDGTDRRMNGIPKTSEESVYYQYPDLRNEFIRFTDPKYQNLSLKDIGKNSHLKAEWQCKTCNHKWLTSISNRTISEGSCPFCCKIKISFPEKYVFYSLKQVDTNLQENYRISNSQTLEFDMYDPVSRLAIEFNGAYHNKNSADAEKLQLAINNNINLIRIWQYNNGKKLDLTDKNNYIIPDNSSINNVPYLDVIINDICMQYGADHQKIDRQLASNQAFLRTNKTPPEGESLLDKFPDICRDWDYTKNGVIRPELLKPASDIKVWWTCFYCEKSWLSSPSWRTQSTQNTKAGCKQCHTKIWRGSLKEIPYIPDNKSNKA